MTPCNYTALREAVGYLSRLGLSLQTVIPVALPAESYPVAKQNSTTGQREVQRDNNGQLLPAFDGKNPSFWLADGEPRLTSQSQPADESEVLKRLDVAERLGQPIELVIIPSTDVVDIDSDRKNYPSKEALDQDWMPLLDFCPELTQTRVERTPGAGSGRGPLTRFSRRNPCPVCGRVKDAKCSTNANGLVLCWRGTTHQPPSWADRKGSHGPGHDGQIWAYLGDSAGWGQFRLDRPLEPRKSIRPKATRAWTYCDRDGTPLITVKRNDDGSGKRKIYQQALVAGKAPRDLQALVMPYGYREALEALEAGAEAVFWVEGEPCVDALRSLGLPAVTSIGGAGKFNPARDGGLFPPDRLVIVPDRDRKGIEHARQIAVAHPGARWLLCWPDQPHLWNGSCPATGGLDVADWIAEGATAEQLLAAITTDPPGLEAAAAPPDGEQLDDGRPIDLQGADALYAEAQGRLASVARTLFRYDAAAGYWQREGDDIYETRAQGLLRRVCKMAANKGPTYPYGSIRHVRDTVASLKVLAGQGPLSSATPPPVVVFRNGTYNLATGTLEPHDPDHGATYGIAADYKAGAACPPELRRLLTTCYPEGAGSIVRALIRWLIDPSIPYGQAFHLLGHTGTGKGTLLAFLLGLLPTDLQSSLGVCRPYRPARRVQRTLRPQTGSIRCRRLLVLLTIAMVLIRL